MARLTKSVAVLAACFDDTVLANVSVAMPSIRSNGEASAFLALDVHIQRGNSSSNFLRSAPVEAAEAAF